MKTLLKMTATLALSLGASVALADASRDCMLEGTVQKGSAADGQQVNVKFHSAEKYSEEANCRVRKGEKMEFKMPADPRLQDADAGSPVKMRYRKESDGGTKAELISVGT